MIMDDDPKKDEPQEPIDWGFDDDHSTGPHREGRSVKRSHRAEGRNWVD